MSNLGLGFAIGVLVLGMALFVPALIDASQGDASDTFELTNQSSEDLTDTLQVEVTRVNQSEDNTNVTVRDLRSLDTNSTQLDAGNATDLTLSGDTINVTADSIINASASQLTVVYPPMFAWDDGPRTFVDNLDIVLALLAMVVILGFFLVWLGGDAP